MYKYTVTAASNPNESVHFNHVDEVISFINSSGVCKVYWPQDGTLSYFGPHTFNRSDYVSNASEKDYNNAVNASYLISALND